MKKIAILFSGHIRNSSSVFIKFKKNFLDILDENNIEYHLYIHIWSNMIFKKNFKNNGWLTGVKYQTKNEEFTEYCYDDDILLYINTIKNLINSEKIIKIKIDKQNFEYYKEFDTYQSITFKTKNKTFISQTTYKEDIISANLNNLKSINLSLNLIDSDIKYDYIYWKRHDIYHEDKFDIKLLEKDIVFPNTFRGGGIVFPIHHFFGKKEKMEKVMAFYEKFMENDFQLLKEFNKKYNTNNLIPYHIQHYYVKDVLKFDVYFSNYVEYFLKYGRFNDYNELPSYFIEAPGYMSLYKHKM